MKQAPNFYRKNAAQGVAQRVMTRKKATPEEMRDSVGQVVTWCYLVALRSVTGWNVQEMDGFLEKATRNAEDYMTRVRVSTSDKTARKWLDGVVKNLAFVLPADKPLKKQADRDELAQKRIGADMAWKIMSAALLRKEPWGCAEDEALAQKVLDEMRDYYENRFLDWAKEGDAYGMERLKRDVESVLGEAVEVLDDGRGAVFANTIY